MHFPRIMPGIMIAIRFFAANPGSRYPHPKQQRRDQQNLCSLATPKASIMVIYLVQSRASTIPNRKGRAQHPISDILQENNRKENQFQAGFCMPNPTYPASDSSEQFSMAIPGILTRTPKRTQKATPSLNPKKPKKAT